jgi:hypothetical protein
MNYLVAVFPNRIKAEEAYTALEKAGLPQSQITIVGKGYDNGEQLGLVDLNRIARKRARQMSYWLIPFGFAAGYTFNSLTKVYLFDWAGELGNHLIGGVFGAIAGAMGSIFVGGGVGLTGGSGDTVFYLNRLNAGEYLVAVEGTNSLKNQATTIFRQFEPESLRTYSPE